MPVTRRRRTIAAPRAEVWPSVSEPQHLPRWWPRVERVEGVTSRGFTEVLRSEKGAVVRADFGFGIRRRPDLVTWTQDLEGTPFAGFLELAETRIALGEDAGAGTTEVEIALEQRLRGLARFGGFLVRRAARKQLDAALDGLAALHED